MSEQLPRLFGRYVLTKVIGEGGMAEVYQASVRVAEGLTKRVVIKKIRKDYANQPEFTRMFVDEAKIALSLNHANIVQVFDFGQVHGAFYLAMELVEGLDLMGLFSSVKRSGDSFPPVIAAYIVHQVAAGLAYAHRKTDDHGQPLGIVHRDVSPHNIMVSYEGQVKILDFGIARTRDRALERLGSSSGGTEETIKGKVAYMSPEQSMGRPVDLRSDVYSLGVVLHELLSGQLLFRTKDRLAALELVRTRPITPIGEVAPDIPEPLRAIVDRALARDPAGRFDTARAFQAELAEFLHRADPVVDDEVLSNFVAQYQRPHPPAVVSGNLDLLAPEVGHSHGTPYPPGPSRSSQRVVVVYVALSPDSLMPGDPPVDPQPFLNLAGDVAFKRDAQVLQLDEKAVVLAFGTLLHAGDDADRAVRAASALRDDVGEMAPGLRLGIVVANAAATVERDPAGAVRVELRRGVGEQLERIARTFLEGPIMISGNLVETLSRAWRVGDSSFVEGPIPAIAETGQPTITAVDRELEHVAPVLGRALETERRVHQAPGGRTLLYGRELDLKTLRDTFAEAIRARESRAVLVLGEPGVGKRALVERFVASLPRTACWVLRATGSYSRRNVPLGVFLDLLTRFLGLDHEAGVPQITQKLQAHGVRDADKAAEALASALGRTDRAADLQVDPFSRRDRLWRLVRRLITALAQRRPVLIVIENVHFHDEQSILLLREWIQRRHPWPVLGVTTGRPGHRRVDIIRRETNMVVIELGELDQKARRELIVRRFEDPERASELADKILARTGGNPLFIEQVLASLFDQGVIAWNAQGRYLVVKQRPGQIELPPSVEAALAGRIEELPRDEREVLQAGAILGRTFRVGEVAALLDRDVDKALDQLVLQGFLEKVPASEAPDAQMRFATVSLHDVCRSGIAPSIAKERHAKAAELIRERDDYTPERDDGQIAEHLVQADRGTEAVEPALRAALRAYDLAGNVEAYYHLSQALSAMAPDDPRRWDALLRRERILRAWGRRRAQGADVRQLLTAAEDHPNPERLVIASIRLLRFYLEVGRTHQAERFVPRLEERIAALTSPAPFLAVLGELRSELMFAKGDFEAAENIARDALSYCGADERGQRQRCRLLRSIGQVHNSVGTFGEARRVYERALEIARSIGNQRLEANLLNALGEVAGRSTRYQEAIDHFKAALAIDRDLGDRYATGRKLANLGITYARLGLYRRAERFLRKALELHEAVGHPGEFNDVVVQLGEVEAELGDLESARALLLDAARVAAGRGDTRTELRARIRLASALATSGDDAGDLETAAVVARQVLETARSHGLRTSRARALHVLALLARRDGRLEEAIVYERDAVALVRAGAAPLDGVLCIHSLGTLLAEHGDTEEAQSVLREAADIVQTRLSDLRDDELRRGYLEQPEVQQILRDGGRADSPSD